MKTDPDCIFCKMISGEIDTNKVYEDELTFAFLDVSPINKGHTLLIPKAHEDHIWNIDNKNYHYLFDVAKKIESALRSVYSPPRVGLVIEGFGVAHAHIHLVPIYEGEELKKPQSRADQEELKKEAKKLQKAL